ncbi:maleylpyruvate isomerase family mycothiol-dependent enzyme [Iamia sp.]|uniref:maleylpyruvate isomerase family mycothiol-dependent enzyme n=1 Tax=Iamia sp. TaxID=2722710 RepID=UPI002C4CFB5E|nr:maleylpyruvate isomerase family mycothiol-dependent enzyme [Iamia sp.]HXH56260.1 maleylpyruvate isomerase family mycothiol-dependent enzyme [Iamia sp.]
MDLFGLVAAERRRLADELEGLTAAEWKQASLCAGWTNHVVAAHLTLPWSVSKPRFLVGLAKERGNIDRAMDRFSHEQAERLDPASCVAALHDHAEDRFTPPGFGPEAPLTDVVVHGADILAPLGRSVTHDPDALRAVLTVVAGPKARRAFGAPSIEGLVLDATDVELRVGTGDSVVSGPALALSGVILGRTAHAAQLSGDGAPLLAART